MKISEFVMHVGIVIALVFVGMELAKGDEPLVSVKLDGIRENVEVYGASSCKEAKEYATMAFQNPNLSQYGESWDISQIQVLDCSKRYGNRHVTIEMTHLDGWSRK